MAPRLTRSSSARKAKAPETAAADKQTILQFSARRKAGSPKKYSQNSDTIHCDENVETVTTKSPLKLTPKRKLFTNTDDNGSSPSKRSPSKTPSSLLKKLEISDSPLKKCHTPGSSLKPKSLFPSSDVGYAAARQALHASQPESLPGREAQLKTLKMFLSARLHNETGAVGSIYISGAPGTGKTASVNLALKLPEIKSGFKSAYINCTSVTTSRAIYGKVAEQLKVNVHGLTEKQCINSIQKYITHSKKKILLILDEVDQLECKNQSVLYTIFEWPCLGHSQLTLMGIANSFDLTDRLLPRLQARASYRPQLLHYPPYTKQQITEIINSRLQEAGTSHVFKSFAIEMLSAKVASVSGDIRRALDIGRRVVELAEMKNTNDIVLRQTSDHGSNTNSPRKSPRKEIVEDVAVGILEVRNVLDGVYGTAQTLMTSTDTGLPIQQKMMLCSLLLMLRKGKNKDVTVGKLHEVYSRVCSKRNMNALSQSEFYSMCTLIETRGIVGMAVSKKETRQSKLTLQWDDDDVSAALCDNNLLADILSDVSCLTGKYR